MSMNAAWNSRGMGIDSSLINFLMASGYTVPKTGKYPSPRC